jgi:hypothetical protein
MKPETKSLEECLQEAAEYERLAHLTRLGINPQDIGIVRILLPQAGRKGGRTGPHAFALTRCAMGKRPKRPRPSEQTAGERLRCYCYTCYSWSGR